MRPQIATPIEILAVCLRFVDLSSPHDPHIKECCLSFLHLDRANADSISRSILENISDPSVSLDPHQIRGQSYGASVISSARAGVQTKIKEARPVNELYLPTVILTVLI